VQSVEPDRNSRQISMELDGEKRVGLRGAASDFREAGAEVATRMRNLVIVCGLICGLVCARAAEEGLASFYHYPGYSGLIAAHRSLPKGSQARVVNLDNGRSVLVTIIDRGPFIRGRVIDVSREAAVELGFRQAGLAHVRIEPITPTAPESAPPAEELAAAAPDEVCKRDGDRLGSLRSNPASGEIVQLEKELSYEKLRPQFLTLAQSSAVSARTQISSEAPDETKPAPSVAGKSASGAHAKWQAPVPKRWKRWVVAWHGFHGRRYASGCVGSCSWRGQERLSSPTRFSANVALARFGHWFD
jgi:rare lipoprotein A